MLSADVVYGIAGLELRARVVAEGLLAGGHRSKRFGSSAEFAEHKLYSPGDDLRRLDWKAVARLDRLFVRRYEDESRLDVVLVVDASESMAYAGGAQGRLGRSKLEVAKTLAAALAWLAVSRADAPGLSVFAGTELLQIPARGRRDHLSQLIAALEVQQPHGPTALRETLERVGDRLTRRSVVIVLSDLIDCGPGALEPLGVLRKRGSDAFVLQVLHADELDFPFDGVVRFEDLEGDRAVQVDAPLVRKAYLEEMQRFLDEIRVACGQHDVRHHLCRSDESPVLTLAEVLH